MSAELPNLRRVVTAHDKTGVAVVQSDTTVPAQPTPFPGVKGATIYITADGLPTKDNNSSEDGTTRKLEDMNLVQPHGTNLRYTDLGPGAITPMHRTTSVDYNILVKGELVLVLSDGSETHLKTAGDVVIQKGNMHAWKNPGSEWARWVCVLIDAEPAVVVGQPLGTAWELPTDMAPPAAES